ncbi:uncharacterized protein LOC125074530 [Vanessa atalanta]|uniref:uncharacterized protein LOC125074530 n=1 Tax=Vanessa atalanta TaxID=42275 RepID=UPI001FCD7425|nr:uncharacterized protein LOC125074530 [Vanessa atalanta]
MPRLLESEITKYLETLEDSEEGLDGSDSEVEDEGHYYQTARDVLRDLENSDEGENAQSDKVDADPPLVIDNDENMPDPPILEAEKAAPQSRSQGISKRPLVWRKRNLVTAEDSLIFRGETQIPEALMSCNTPLQGYAHRFEVYSGGGSKNNILPGEPDLGESGNTVVRLARMVPRNVNHIIYFDNFYTSVPLVTYLAKEGIFSLGTVRVNRLRNCKLPEKNTIMKKNVPRGFYEENVATVDDIDVSAVVWKDNKPVNLLSTYVGAEPATTVTRFDKSKKERVAIPCPKVIKEYNAHMGGVDLLDSFIGRYHITMKSRNGTVVPPVSSLLAVDRCPEHPNSEVPRAAPRQLRSRVSKTRRSDGREVASSSGGGCGALEGATAVVQAESKDGTYFPVRVLLDQGSQGSFITEAMVQHLGLKRLAVKNTVVGVGGDKSVTSKSTVKINLRSRVDPRFQVKVNAHVLKSVTSLLPVAKTTRVEWDNLTLDDLADPEYHTPNKIDLLLGAEIYSQIIQEGIKRNLNGSLLAQDTAFGWIISGVCEVDSTSNIHSHTIVMHSYLEVDNMLKRFWELEAEPPVTKRMLTDDEIKCEKLFKETTKRDGDGRFIVRLPFRMANPDCMRGEFRKIAEKRLRNLEFKLQKNNKLKEDYTQVIREYLNLNHMVKVTDKDKFKKTAIYLPHHAVVREDKDTTKVRVVFDASCKGSNGKSLNDDLLIGPPLQAELRHTIMRWRQYKICLVADVVKMYRQVLVNREDTPFQRILWRDSPEKELQEFELLTVTFGTACAPYLAVRSMQELAYKECQNKPVIAKIILNDFYMDDVMTGADNLEDAYKIYKELTEVLAKGGFPLQKWKSNSKEILAKIWKAKGNTDEELRIKVDDTTKILGLTWDPRGDFFRYSVDLAPQEEPVTKRRIISDISRLFDPLGWLAPCIIAAKILIQKLWLAGIGWDEQVPTNLINEWITYRKNLTALQNIKIPRWIHTSNKYQRELYGFSDASKVAYAAVVYLRVVDDVGNVYVSLVTAKTKVAPIKQVSIPRLELCGAVLLAKLMVEVAEVMKVERSQLHAFTDSEVVLAWLNNHPSRWKTFVANRVSEILQILDTHHWSHVATKKNPADLASRGISPVELSEMVIWFEGPEFLKNKVIICTKPKDLVTNLEQVKVHTAVVNTELWERFSSFSKLVRVVAYCRRWLRIKKGLSSRPSSEALERQEIEDSITVCIKKCQEEGFREELEELQKHGIIDKKKKKLRTLNIFLDSEGVIRVGGRLEMSSLSFNGKHPILIPKESFLSGLLIADAHQKTLHGGPSTSQLMGQLPSARVTPNKPFLVSGVDYAGPINIRISKGRGNKSYKGYIALFICMSTRAVHLEVVSELSTLGFIAAFKRFVARRGRCAELYSDNGSNFVGAARELLCLFSEEKTKFKPELAQYLATNGTQWNFIPPRAPNFGGLWEAGIKSTKFHLKRVVGNSTLTYEEMATVLAQIEACLNSRPLSRVEDPTEAVVLTPGHFLVGEPLVVVPEVNYESANMFTLRRWQLHQRMMQDFWRRWSQDYLHQFLQRHKWEYQNPEPSVGDVVLVKEDDLPPARWLLGKVEQKHPGPDKITRVVTILINSWVMFKKVNNMKGNDQLLNLGTFRLELAETLCKLGLPANGAKRGRPSGSTIQRELVMKKFRGPAQAIPLKDHVLAKRRELQEQLKIEKEKGNSVSIKYDKLIIHSKNNTTISNKKRTLPTSPNDKDLPHSEPKPQAHKKNKTQTQPDLQRSSRLSEGVIKPGIL